MSQSYLRLEDLLDQIDEPFRSGCRRILAENRTLFQIAPGSSHNHQAWTGGYLDHIQETLNIAVVLYERLNALRALPFFLSDALLILFLHDLEKPWAYEKDLEGNVNRREVFKSKSAQQRFRVEKLGEYGLRLTFEHENAMRYVEGELDHYTNRERVMSPLAAFCHLCDVASARLWFDHPLGENDAWNGARRFRG